ncbi:MAG: family 16 glycosylhydrolase [Clostridia bacterium]|nr:family 16 glycosylhydrolase [Clostridia bacterium]
MKKLLSILLMLALLAMLVLALGCAAAEEIPQYEGYNLVWNDEFDGEVFTFDDWNWETRRAGWTNNELQAYNASRDNIFLRDGKLVLKAIKSVNQYGKTVYTSGKVQTLDKHNFLYGRIDVRAKVPAGQGLWPAIWMMPTRDHYGSWPRGGEIDIMEFLGHDVKTVYANLHYGDPHAEQQGVYTLENGETFTDSFHVFSVEWDPGEFRFYVDGNHFHTINDWYSRSGASERPYPAPFNKEFYIQLNLAVGGNWPGNPDETTDFDKAEFEIDYVRVYQRPEYDTNVKKPEKQYREAAEDGNLLYNGSFTEAESVNDSANWVYYQCSGGNAAVAIRDGMIVIDTKTEGTLDYSVQLYQANLPMFEGTKYRFSFDAWADEERQIIAAVSAPSAGWIRYFPDTVVNLTPEKTTYTYEFTMKDMDDNNGRVEFNMGHRGSTAAIYITNVRLEPVE